MQLNYKFLFSRTNDVSILWILYSNSSEYVSEGFLLAIQPHVPSYKRKILSPPKVIENIPTRVRRKGREIYKQSDLWTQEDVALFFKIFQVCER